MISDLMSTAIKNNGILTAFIDLHTIVMISKQKSKSMRQHGRWFYNNIGIICFKCQMSLVYISCCETPEKYQMTYCICFCLSHDIFSDTSANHLLRFRKIIGGGACIFHFNVTKLADNLF